MTYLTERNITLSKTSSYESDRECSYSLQRHCHDLHDQERSIDRSSYGAFINSLSSLAKGVRRVLLANSSGELMLSKGIAMHSETVIQPACIESVLVRHPRGFSLLQSTLRVSHMCAQSRTRTHGHVSRMSIFGVVRASYHREGICDPRYQTLMQHAGVSEAVLQSAPNDCQPPFCRTSLCQRFVSVEEQRANPR